MRDIGDGDDEVPAAGVRRVAVGLGPHRVVEIARIATVDRHQIEVSQIDAAGGIDRPGGGRFGERGFGKDVRDAKAGD
jgi:hypothetical protein